MKKLGFIAVIAAAVGLASCTGKAPKANLKNEVDSLSYMIGMTNTQGLDGYLTQQFGVDTTYMKDFAKGVTEGINVSKAELAHAAGIIIGKQVSGDMLNRINQSIFGNDSTLSLSKDDFLAGFISTLMNEKSFITMQEAQEYVQKHAEVIKAKAMEAKYGDNKIASEKFMAENAKKEGVKTTESGLQYKVIKAGKGEIPTEKSTVKVHYKGTLIDGTEFDSSYQRKEPATFRANQVIKGWTEALTMMPVGSKWELYIPQELAYGSRETAGGKIKPFSALIFEVELLDVEKK